MAAPSVPGASAHSPSLVMYLNSDAGMERPYRVSIPESVDTLAELCQYITARLPLRPDDDTTGRGYRFLYTITGKPLWRVKECIDACTIVVSVGPGFLARRPTGLTTAPPPPPAAPAISVTDITPNRPAKKSVVLTGSGQDRSPSSSPPVKQPVYDSHHIRNDVKGNLNAGSLASYQAGIASAQGDTTFDATSAGSAAGKQLSADVSLPPEPSLPRTSQSEGKDRLFSITLNTTMRGRKSFSEEPILSQPQSMPTSSGCGAPSHLAEDTPKDRPGTPGVAGDAPAPLKHSTALPRTDVLTESTSYWQAEMPDALHAATPLASAASTSRGIVYLEHKAYSLPPRPAFARPLLSTDDSAPGRPHQQRLPATSISSTLEYFLLRKWAAYQRLHITPPADVVAGEALSLFFNTLLPKDVQNGGAPCRILVSGPPRSGVSTTASFLLRHYLWTQQFQPQHALHNSVLLILDFNVLFGQVTAAAAATTARGLKTPPSPLLLDLSALYQLIVRSVIDAVVTQRPALRGAEQLLAQLWDLVIKPNVQPPAPPNFTTFSQAAALVGTDVLSSWTKLAQEIYPILQAACRTPEVLELRSAAIDLIFYAIPAELANSLHFSGLFYVLDGLDQVAGCYAHRVTRPAGDLRPLLQAITADPRTHVVIAWPSMVSPHSIYVSGLTAHVSTIGLVTRSALTRQQFPEVLRCRAEEYPLEIFLGCPGYLSTLLAMTKPFRKTLSIPTTAFSAFYQKNYTRNSSQEGEGYALRLDTPAAARALEALLQVVQALPVR